MNIFFIFSFESVYVRVCVSVCMWMGRYKYGNVSMFPEASRFLIRLNISRVSVPQAIVGFDGPGNTCILSGQNVLRIIILLNACGGSPSS